MADSTKRKLYISFIDGEHFWNDPVNFPDVPDRQVVLDIAQETKDYLSGQPVLMEEGRLAIDPEKIQCKNCRSRLERGG